MTPTPTAGSLAPRGGPTGRRRRALGAHRRGLAGALLLLALAGPAAAQRVPGYDDDGDGVPNALDTCLFTDSGVPVDERGCPLPRDADARRTILLAAGALVAVLALGGVVWVRRARREAGPEEHVPLILFTPRTDTAGPAAGAVLAPPAPSSQPPTAPPAAAPSAQPPAPAPPPSRPVPRPAQPAPTSPSLQRPTAPPPPAGGAAAPPAAPADTTLRLLPGRLEVVAGAADREIRFVQGPAPVTEITVGRQSGPPARHLQLPAPTVSRLHARLRFEGGRWTVANLSMTNPVVLNGAPMTDGAGERRLAEGDRIEVGEYIFIFHER